MTVLEALTDATPVTEDETLLVSREFAHAADRLYDSLDDVLNEVKLPPKLRRQIEIRMRRYDLALKASGNI